MKNILILSGLFASLAAWAKPGPAKTEKPEPKESITHVVSAPFLMFSAIREEIRILPGGEVRYRTISPAPARWDETYVVGEFATKADAALFSRIRTAVKPKTAPAGERKYVIKPGNGIETFTLTDKGTKPLLALREAGQADPVFDSWKDELDKLKEKARAHPVNAVKLSCRRADDFRCVLTAVGTENSVLPLPGPTPYTFYCFDNQKHMVELAKISKPATGGVELNLELKPGKPYPFVMPKDKSCDRSVVLTIGTRGKHQGLFEQTSIVSGPIQLAK